MDARHGIIGWISRALALFGGLVLVAMALMTFVSITGRSLIWAGFGPVPGDFELVEIGAAVAVFSFLPYCHLMRGHVTVDLLVERLPPRAFSFLTLLGDLTIALIAGIVAWRLWLGLGEKLQYGESTMILGAPLWYGFALSMVGAAWFFVVSIYVLWLDLGALRRGERIR